jgi:4-diphosphocytidyl-2-C-methyl-D-erythritol kinase
VKAVRLIAPAKVNWTLEVLGKRADGYHEIRSVMQTVNLFDTITLRPADDLTLSVRGGTRSFRRRAAETPEANLAYRAAQALRTHGRTRAGATILLHKNVPIAAGLGGGSSDAAAVLRGLRALWAMNLTDDALLVIGAGLGSDVPFFLKGGTGLVSGRGEIIDPLPDVAQPDIVITTRRTQRSDDKTARMYRAIGPEHYSDGSRSEALAARIREGARVREDSVCNAFEAVLEGAAPAVAAAMAAALSGGVGKPHLCGSGPALFYFADGFHAEHASPAAYHNAFVPVRAIPSAEATAMTVDG